MRQSVYMRCVYVITIYGNDQKWAVNADISSEMAEAMKADGIDISPLYTAPPPAR